VTVGEELGHLEARLARAGIETPRVDAEHLLAHALGLDRADLRLASERRVTAGQLEALEGFVGRREAREPLQYVLGEWGFRRLTLGVDSRALIPRPETEVVVERCLALLANRNAPRVLDVGTGSGAIALAIADEHPGARITGIDASSDALALAAENAARTGLTVELRRRDLFDGLPSGPWDLVVANPPYVAEDELAQLAPEVRDWEPRSATVAHGQTEAVAHAALAVLTDGGALVLETHAHGARAVEALLIGLGYGCVRVTADLAGFERVVEGVR
jgi:release factor glutamine methyltransferase